MMVQKPLAVIFLLDCCRSYCMINEALTRGESRSDGLSAMADVRGSLIAFACAPNKTASDGSDNHRNGIFTAHLLKHITEPNTTIEKIMTKVCDGVVNESKHEQWPFRVSSLRQDIYLNLQDSPVRPTQQQILPSKNINLESLIARSKSHAKIDLSKRRLTDDNMETVVVHAMEKKQCIYLWLTSNSISYRGASILADGLKNNSYLEQLDLHQNMIKDIGVQFLCKALSDRNQTLKILNLGENEITDEGANSLAEMLRKNVSLTHVYLHDNQIGDSGCQLIANALTNDNQTVEELYLNGNQNITDLSIDNLVQMSKKNKKLCQIHVEQCDLSPIGKQRLTNLKPLNTKFRVYVNNSFS